MADKKDFSNFGTQNFKKHEPTANLPEKESNTEKVAADVFSGVLESREKKSRRMQLLLTEANFDILADVSKKTGRSKNDIINRLISTLGENTDL
jgi:hypothetical protein